MSKLQLANNFLVAVLSDCGLKREKNEDNYGLDAELSLLLLADGMGGYTRGDKASSSAIQHFSSSLQALTIEPKPTFWFKMRECLSPKTLLNKSNLQPTQQAEQLILDLLVATHNNLLNLNQQFPTGSGVMGTTLVGLWLWPKLPEKVLVFHVGDSRAYRYRDGQLKQLTNDHSLYQQWLDNGKNGQQPSKNIVSQALGVVPVVQPEISLHSLQDADRFLLCSDGLTTMVDDCVLQEVMAQLTPKNLEQSCQYLIDQANANGGLDNVSVILSCHKGCV